MISRSPEHLALWQRIDAFEFDKDAVARTFTQRLAQEHRWELGYAVRAVIEYKRFAFLAIAAGHPVSPSDAVDEVWHLHLLYTQSYWDDFCPNALGRTLHHFPSMGGTDEAAKHRDWYAQTLVSYQRFFGEEPPADIWPDLATRANEMAHARHVRVDAARAWIVPKPRLPWLAPRTSSLLRSALLVCATLAFSVRADELIWPLDLAGPEFLLLFFFLTFTVLAGSLIVRSFARGPGGRFAISPVLTPDELAYLAGQSKRFAQVCIARLMRGGYLVIEPESKRLTIGTPLPSDASASDKKLVAFVKSGSSVRGIEAALKSEADRIRDKLRQMQLIVGDDASARASFGHWLLFGSLLLLGITKVAVGLGRNKPILFLLVFEAAAAILAAFTSPRLFLTRRGENLLDELQVRNRKLERGLTEIEPLNDHALAVALFGTAVMTPALYGRLAMILEPPPVRNRSDYAAWGGTHGCTGTSACGGGGGGGGCGGGGGGGCGGCSSS